MRNLTILYRTEADRLAKSLGATLRGSLYYPSREAPVPVFQYTYFSEPHQEIGHWLPDLKSFAVFCKPRQWGVLAYAELENLEEL